MSDARDISDGAAARAPETEPLPPPEALVPEAVTPLPEPLPPQEPAPMIDIHPPQHGALTRRDFFVHLFIVVLGILIAIGLEQGVEVIHRHLEAREARRSISEEVRQNIEATQKDVGYLAVMQKELGRDLDLLTSSSDSTIPAQLDYTQHLLRRRDAAWTAAKINGSLALISSKEVAATSYFYETAEEVHPVELGFFTAMDDAQALLDHAKATGRMTAFDRQQLLTWTADALGGDRNLARIYGSQLRALQQSGLR